MKGKPTIIKSFAYAFSGVVYCIRTERNFRIHMAAAVTSAILAYFYKISSDQISLLLFTIVFVFVTEMVNTAVEKVVDICSPDYSRAAKIAKDVAAGAVLVAAVCAVGVAVLLFWDATKLALLWNELVARWWHVAVAVVYVVLVILFIGKRKK